MVMQMQPMGFGNELQNIIASGNYQVAPKFPKPVAKYNSSNVVDVKLPGTGYTQSQSPQSSSSLDKLLSAIRQQESSGNYNAVNKNSGASGGYQIMPFNINGAQRGWDWEALHKDISMQQFLNSPQLQDQIARFKLQQYLSKYGAAGAAVAWYGGPGAVAHMYDKKPQNGYPSLYAYWNSVLSRM